jgi:hypothetical protein
VGELTYAARLARADAFELKAAEQRAKARKVAIDLNTRGRPFIRERCHATAVALGFGKSSSESGGGWTERSNSPGHLWHKSLLASETYWLRRARGQRERIERVETCGQETYVRACPCCGGTDGSVHPVLCANWKICGRCLLHRQGQKRAKSQGAIEYQRQVYERQRERPFRKFRERLITFTVPHSGSVAADIAHLHKTQVRFGPVMRAWLAEHRHEKRLPSAYLPFIRSVEVASIRGAELEALEGHAHQHVWTLGPFIAHQVLRVLWGRSFRIGGPSLAVPPREWPTDLPFPLAFGPYMPVRLIADALADTLPQGPLCVAFADREHNRKCEHTSCRELVWRRRAERADVASVSKFRNRELAYLPWPVLDVRAAYGQVGNEVVKYVFKNLDSQGKPLDSFQLAQIVEAMEGRRMFAASRHLWCYPGKDPLSHYCEDCLVPREHLPLVMAGPSGARGPPAYVHT